MNKNINLLGKLITRKALQDEKQKRDKIKNRKTDKLRKVAKQEARRRAKK